MFRLSTAILLAACLVSPVRLQAQTTEWQLDNGLQVMLIPLRTASKTALVVLYDVGNRHDPPDQSGLSHLAEHLYVTAATEKTPARNVNEYMGRYPDGWNAQTGDDYTVIATVFAAGQLDEELADAADRMRRIVVRQSDLDRELPRIDEELANMYDRAPMLAVGNHGRHHAEPLAADGRRGGKIDDLKVVSVEVISQWLDKHYKPCNATLVLAGMFEVAEVRAAIEQQFASIPAGEQPVARTAETAAGDRNCEVGVKPFQPDEPARVGYTYHVPECGESLYAPFLVMAARFMQATQTTAQKGEGVPFMWTPLDDPRFFHATTSVANDETIEAAFQRLDEMVNEQLSTTLGRRELAQTENAFALFLGLRELPPAMLGMNPYAAAFSAGRRHQMGLDTEQLRDELAAVDEQQLARVVSEVFAPANRVSVVIKPDR